MKKEYAVEDLRIGMKIAEPVLDENGTVVVEAGTVLDDESIFSILEQPVFGVMIDVDVPKHAPVKDEHILDDSYLADYKHVYDELGKVFEKAHNKEFDVERIRRFFDEPHLIRLSKGVRAVTQLYNMERSGDYVLHHSVHVAVLAGLMGRWLDFSPERRRRLMIAGLLLDIGKVWIPSPIIQKPGRLTHAEFNIMKRHSQMGYEFLKQGPLSDEDEILNGILQHHERGDGTGYPLGLIADQTAEFAKILAILDIYDAMSADRVYARRRSPFDVFQVISDDILSGRLDTFLGVKFIRNLCHALNGHWVKLNNGEEAKIVYIDESRISSLPVVETEGGDFIDLNTDRSKSIDIMLTYKEQGS